MLIKHAVTSIHTSVGCNHVDAAALVLKEYQSKLAAVASQKRARAILSDELYLVSTGSGDFIQNYYTTPCCHAAMMSTGTATSSSAYSPASPMSKLYRMGTQRISVTLLGCFLASIRLYASRRRGRRAAACQTGTAKTRVYLCNPATAGMCQNASDFVYFDGVHPSEAANIIIADSMISAGISLVT
ncbi:hypothetical protein ABZP36_022415 [Zizania latifolia]